VCTEEVMCVLSGVRTVEVDVSTRELKPSFSLMFEDVKKN